MNADTPKAAFPSIVPAALPGTVRDRLWVFCCQANTDFRPLQMRSVMSPAEAAFYLGVPNIIMVQSSSSEAQYGRFDLPFHQYTIALRPLKRVAWTIVGSGGFTDPAETREVLQLARTVPNFAGVMLDDFFTGKAEGKRAQLTVDELRAVREELAGLDRRIDILTTLYWRFVDLPLGDYLDLIDVISLWGSPEDLPNLDANLARIEKARPGARLLLGCYVVDYKRRCGLDMALMRMQCEKGLKWLKDGRIEGIVFLGNTSMDLDFPSVEWAREWVGEVGEQRLP